jgi:hypothetical protein
MFTAITRLPVSLVMTKPTRVNEVSGAIVRPTLCGHPQSFRHSPPWCLSIIRMHETECDFQNYLHRLS